MSKRQRDTREHARRAAELRRRVQARRTRMRRAVAANVAVVVVFAGLVVGWLAGVGEDTPAPAPAADDTTTATVVAAVTGVPVAVLDAVGASGVQKVPDAIAGQPALTESGKPLVVYIGAEYCPFCAAQRWPMVVALSRFGTFSGLRVSASAADDVYPNTPTLSFHGSTYTSRYLAFQGVETNTNVRVGRQYGPLDPLTAQQQQIMAKYNAPPYVDANSAGAIPFVDFGNRALTAGSSFSPQLLAGMSAADVAAALSDKDSAVGRAVTANANAITALLCRLTGGQPGEVCAGPAVTAFNGRFDDVTAA